MLICARCPRPLTSRKQRIFCSAECQREGERERAADPKHYDQTLLTMRAQGESLRTIAKACGMSVGAIKKRAIRLGLAAEDRQRGTAEQNAIMRQMYPAGGAFEDIRTAVNAIPGYRLKTSEQMVAWAKRLKVKRPPHIRLANSRVGGLRRWKPKPAATAGGPEPLLLREVYQWGAMLQLPLAQRGNVEAVSRAMRRTEPDHPGFRLTTISSRRMSDAWR